METLVNGAAAGIMMVPYAAFFIIMACVHIAFALGVHRSARILAVHRPGTFCVSHRIWAAGALVGGVMVVLAFWIIHFSTLKPNTESQEPQNGSSNI